MYGPIEHVGLESGTLRTMLGRHGIGPMMDPTTDLKTRPDSKVQRAIDGDRSALDALLGRTHGRLRRIADRIIGPRLRARVSVSDIVQSCYVEIIRGIRSFRDSGDSGDGAFEAWSRRVLENGVRRKSRHFSAEKRTAEVEDVAFLDEPAGEGPTPSRAAVNGEALLQLQTALEQLSSEHREIIRLRILEGRAHDEIAEILDKSPTAVRMSLSRARAKLSLVLGEARDAS